MLTPEQAIVFILIGVLTACGIYKVLQDMTYRMARRAIHDERESELQKAKGETKMNP